LPSELKLIDPEIIERLAAERKSSKASAIAPEVPGSPVTRKEKGSRREANRTGVRCVKSAKEKSASLKRETVQSTAADLNVYVVTCNMNGKVRKPTAERVVDVSSVFCLLDFLSL